MESAITELEGPFEPYHRKPLGRALEHVRGAAVGHRVDDERPRHL
jgi:hypothetical protein